MIYLFAGDDAGRKLKSYEIFLASLPKDLEVFSINKNDFSSTELESFYSGSGLFFTKCAVILPHIFEREEAKDFILEKLPLLSDSPSTFIFLEGKLNKATLDAFRGARAELNVFELTKDQKEKYNNFLLADAFVAKDKLQLWIYFRQAMDRGVGMEELVGVLFWKIKDMIIKKNFSKFSQGELQETSSKLSFLLPEARKRGLDAEAVFEQFLLEAF